MPPLVCICLLLGTLSLAQAEDKEITIAVRAIQGNKIALQRWQPTADYLGEKIDGYRFKVIPYDSLVALSEAAKENRFDFVFTNPSSYVEMNLNYKAKSLSTLINRRNNTAQTRFGSVIFTHVDNTEIDQLADLKGKKFMAVSEPAFGGWQVGWLEMKRQGMDPYQDLAELQWGNGNQHNVVYAVRDKKVHAGVVRTDMLERMEANKLIDLRTFRIISPRETEGFPFFHSTPLYPEWPLAAMPGSPEKLQQDVQQALLNMPKDHSAAKAGQYVGWIDSLSYEPVRQLMQELAVGPYKTTKQPGMSILKWGTLIVVILFVLFVIRKKALF